jgi:hypothetical protein
VTTDDEKTDRKPQKNASFGSSSLNSIEPDADCGAVEHKSARSALRERTSIQGVNPRGEAVSSRMAGASAQEEIDEPTGRFLRPRSDIAHLELLA